jgi:lipopolysaccharide/colanic/teichoic acid biosynthesis glycosyltransferase
VGKPLDIHKFRTMKVEYSTGEQFGGRSDGDVFDALGIPELAEEFARAQKLRYDPRVSRIGHFLRRNSLDELPQLWNIVKGELSVVGPRPIVSAELDRYGSGQDTLLSLKPGLTGLWQISGRSDLDYADRVKLDLHYAENWSLLLDLKIILRTLSAVLRRRGAY